MAMYYKAMRTISSEHNASMILMAIFDTRAGPKLVWEDVMPKQWSTRVQQIRANIRTVGDTAFAVKDVERPQVEICGHVTTAAFGVVPKLAAKTILGPAFIDKEIKQTQTSNQQVLSNGGIAFAIVESFENEAVVQTLKNNKTRDDETSKTNSPTLNFDKEQDNTARM